jgi:hypothetical protein
MINQLHNHDCAIITALSLASLSLVFGITLPCLWHHSALSLASLNLVFGITQPLFISDALS